MRLSDTIEQCLSATLSSGPTRSRMIEKQDIAVMCAENGLNTLSWGTQVNDDFGKLFSALEYVSGVYWDLSSV